MDLPSGGPIYLDYHSHAPLDPRVAEVLADGFRRFDANPHSLHVHGEQAHKAVEAAREHVADLIDAEPSEIVFTSGATEANNLAILGIGHRLGFLGNTRILVSAGEHPSVLAAADAVANGPVERIPLLEDGLVDLIKLDRLLESGSGLVSIAAANHEIGAIQPLAHIAEATTRANVLLHSDLAQAAGKIAVDAKLIDLGSVSSHKLGGPVGIGALFVKRRLRRHLRSSMFGGGQEAGLRPGTLPAPLCVAFGEACRIAKDEMHAEARRVSALREELHRRLATVGGVELNGGNHRLPGNLNVSFLNVDAEALMLRVRSAVSVSSGSACTATSLEPSHVLKAIGLSSQRAESAIRFGLGRFTTAADISTTADVVIDAVLTLRAMTRKVA